MDNRSDLLNYVAEIVAAYVANNSVPTGDLPQLLSSVHSALQGLGQAREKPGEPLVPAVSVKKSVTPDYLISLEDGKQYRTLKRHLRTRGMTPHEYRTKWGLPANYPMVAQSYSEQRSKLAQDSGLGSKRRKLATKVVAKAKPSGAAKKAKAAT